MRWIVVLLFLTFSNTHVTAQTAPPPPDSLTLDQAIATALQNNYDIILARNDSAVAAINYSYRNIALLPQVNGNGTILFNNNNQSITLADATKHDRSGIKSKNIAASVALNWVVFDGLRMFATRAKAGELLKLGTLEAKNQINNTVADVILAYYGAVRAVLQLRVIDEQIVLNEDRYQLAKYRFEIGVGVKPDMLQAQIDLNAQKSARLSQLAAIEVAKQNLNRLLNVSPQVQYKVSDTILVRMDLTLSDLQSNLEQTNTQLRVAQKNIDVAGLTLRENRAALWPVISLNSAYNFTKNANNSVINPFQPLISLNKGFNYGITATVPIFNGLNTRRLIRQAELSLAYQQTLYANQHAVVNTDLYNAYTNYQLQKDVVTLEESNIGLTRENLFIARERYRLAAATFLELREAESSLQQAYDRLIAARYNMKVAETELLRLKGSFVH